MSHTLVDLIDISKSFGDQIVLDKLNLSIGENEFSPFWGPAAAVRPLLCASWEDLKIPIPEK